MSEQSFAEAWQQSFATALENNLVDPQLLDASTPPNIEIPDNCDWVLRLGPGKPHWEVQQTS